MGTSMGELSNQLIVRALIMLALEMKLLPMFELSIMGQNLMFVYLRSTVDDRNQCGLFFNHTNLAMLF